MEKARARRVLPHRHRHALLHIETLEERIVPSTAPPILETFRGNGSFDTSNPNWAHDLVGGRTFASYEAYHTGSPKWQWTSVLNPQSELDSYVTGLSGTAINPMISSADLPFSHPFGNDFEFFIAPDSRYSSLLARSNKEPPLDEDGREYREAIEAARALLPPEVPVPGVLGVETDQALVPIAYQPRHGDRVAVFGQWIVDAGHDDFHTEIHPPLLIASARPATPTSTEWTTSTVVGRPYRVSQEYLLPGDRRVDPFLNGGSDDGAFIPHLINELGKVVTLRSTRVEAHPAILDQSAVSSGWMFYDVRPPSPREDPGDTLVTSFHFTVRDGVQVDLVPLAGQDEVLVSVLMNAPAYSYRQAALPHKTEVSIYDYPTAPLLAVAAQALGILPADPRFIYLAAVLGQGVRTDRYDAPRAASVHDSENVVESLPVSKLPYPSPTPVSVDNSDSQPFPVYGYINVGWQRAARTLAVSAPANSPAATPFNVTVTAKDRLGNVARNYRGTVHFTNTDEAADLPADYTFTDADNGVHTFPVTLRRAGSHTLTVADTAKPSLAGSAAVRALQNFSVNNGALTVYGDQLAALDWSSSGGVQINLNGPPIQFYPGTVRSINLYGGIGATTINVLRTAPSVPVSIDSGKGGAVITVGNAANGVQGIQGPLNIRNDYGLTTLTLSDVANNTPRNVLFSANSISGLAPAPITFASAHVNALTIAGGSGGNTFTVQSTATGTTTTLNLGAGGDMINVGDAANTMDRILGVLTVHGQGGNSTLNLNNQGEGYPNGFSYNVYADHIGPLAADGRPWGVNGPFTFPPLYYSGIARLVLNGPNRPSSGSNFYVWGIAAGTRMTINGSDYGSLILAPLGYTGRNMWQFTGPNTGTLNDNLTFTGMSYLLASSYGTEVFAFHPGGSLAWLAASTLATDTVDLSAYGREVTVSLAARELGGDIWQGNVSGVIGAFRFLPTIIGSAGSTLYGPNAATTWALTGTDTGDVGSAHGNVHFSGFANLVGGSAADVFQVRDGGSVTGSIDGGEGTNTLDYSASTGNVFANLQTATATGVAGGITNIQNVTGSGGPGYSILVGNGGNILTGGRGRNLLIAGQVSSTLIGGSDEDIVIGGTTTYDTDLAALQAIMTYWTGTDDYATRVANLASGSGVPRLDATTVSGNGGGNTLTGGAGLDLFYGNLALDTYDWDPWTETFIVV
jgi:hypothetical protein